MDNITDIIKQIEDCRNRLLDLSMKNSLINFKHSDKLRNQISIVNININFLYSELVVKKKVFTINPLPEKPDEPEDEQTKEFRNAYEQAKLNDEEYQSAIHAEEIDDLEIERLERKIKDRVREQLNLPRREDCKYTDKEWAEINNININEDIPENIETKETKLWVKRYKNELSKKVIDLNRQIKQDEENRGVNTLYLAIGFLQYYNSSSSSKASLAPLILVKLQKISGKGTYSISYTGDEIRKNEALEKKLQQFNIVLPDFNNNENIEGYFKKINEAVREQKGWKVKRYVTIGRFIFSRLTMYADLDLKKNWKNIKALISANKNLQHFFRGDTTENTSFSYDIDKDREVRENANILVSPADSSQHSAIIEAMKGESLIIKGPPGTGKSQTIVNLIANALNKGKKVLFVSEKKAALDVVYERLKKANLENFCLELHSDKTNFANLRTSLETPIKNISKSINVTAIDEFKRKENELQEKKLLLRDYYDFLSSTIGKEKLTEVDAIWNIKNYEDLIGKLAIDLRSIKIEHADEIDAVKFVSILDKLGDLRSSDKSLRNNDNNSKKDNFDFSNLKSADIFQLYNQIEQKKQIVSNYSKNISKKYKSFEFEAEPTINHIQNMAEKIAEIKDYIDTKQFNSALLTHLRNKDFQVILENIIQEIEKYVPLEQVIKDNIIDKPAEFINSISIFTEKYNNIKTSPLGINSLRRDELINLSQQLKNEYLFFSKNQNILKEAGQIIFRQSVLSLPHILQTILILREYKKINPIIFNYIPNKEIVSPNNLLFLTAMKEDIDEINTLKRDIQPHFDLSFVEEKGSDINKAYNYWENKTPLAFLNIRYWQAKQLFSKVQRRKNYLINIDKYMRKLSNYVTKVTEFKSNQQYKKILGHLLCSKEISISEIIEANHFYNKIQQQALNCIKYNIKLNPDDWDINEMQCLHALSQQIVEIDNCSEFTTLQTICSNCSTYETALKYTKDLINKLEDFTDCCLEKLKHNVYASKMKDCIETANECIALKNKIGKEINKLKKDIPILNLQNGRNVIEARNTLYLAKLISGAAFSPKIKDCFFNSIKTEVKNLYTDFNELSQQASEIKNIMSFIQQSVQIKFNKYAIVKSIGLLPIKFFVEALNDLLSLKDYAYARCSYESNLNSARQTECKDLINYFSEKNLPFDNIEECFKFTFYSSLFDSNGNTKWRDFVPEKMKTLKQRMQKLDSEIYSLAQRALISTAQENIKKQFSIIKGYDSPTVSEKTELALLRHIINPQSRAIPIRQVIARAGKAIQVFKPCMLMSPISVAQYIPPDSLSFDMLIIDEASQMYFEEALGSLLRSKQFIIVGDEKQLPPTNFFQNNNQVNNNDWDDTPDDNVSILEMCLQRNYNLQELLWHYRSKDQSLIAFSNLHFYNNELNIPPSVITPEHREEYESGVSYRYVNGLYKNSKNDIEAEEIAKEVQRFVRAHPDKSLGIATMNSTQQELIEQKIDILRDTDSKVAEYLISWENKLESFFVKNLENVQGDERDYIFVSTVYGPEESKGNVAQRFGPINGRYGYRRLNVLFTRAKYGLKIFTSLKDRDIKITPTSSQGLRIFQEYLAYAETGQLTVANQTQRSPDSPFENAVRRILENKGYKVDTQVGVKGFFIDLAVRHPKHPALYIVGIECDGATYHSSKSARDRDCIRQSILEASGWKIYRIWSQDWFHNTDKEIEKLLNYLEQEMAKDPKIKKRMKIDINNIQAETKITLQNDDTKEAEISEEDLFYTAPQKEKISDDIVIDFGDLVEYEQNGKIHTVQITRGSSEPEKNLVNEYTPIGAALLGQSVDGEELSVNDFTIVIRKITKAKDIKK